MIVEEAVQGVLTGASGLATPDQRIKTPGDWQALARPNIIHGPVAMEPIELHQGRATLTAFPYQISIFADTYSAARTESQAVMAAVALSTDPKFFLRNMVTMFDDERNVHHVALEYDVWYE